MRALIPGTVLAERCPDILRRGRYSLLDAADTVECGTDIQREDWRAVGLRGRRVVVDDIAHLFASTSADDPVMAVEGRLVATVCRQQGRTVAT